MFNNSISILYRLRGKWQNKRRKFNFVLDNNIIKKTTTHRRSVRSKICFK